MRVFPDKKTRILSLGQAGFVIQSKGGHTLAIDPYFSECVERAEGHMGFKRLLPRLYQPDEMDFDVIIATHEHLDHYDVDSMPILMRNEKTILFCSEDCEAFVKEEAIDRKRVNYVKPGDTAAVAGFNIRFVNCDHGDGAPDAVGVVVEVDGKRIYEAGDTCLRLDRKDEVLEFGGLDILIAPINGAYGNMNEEDCATFCKALKPALVIPCHYGMFASHGGNPGLFIEHMNRLDPKQRILLMRMGESVML